MKVNDFNVTMENLYEKMGKFDIILVESSLDPMYSYCACRQVRLVSKESPWVQAVLQPAAPTEEPSLRIARPCRNNSGYLA